MGSMKARGFTLVAVGAAIWGSDALFRRGLALELPASVVVFAEHVILTALTIPLAVRALRRRPAFTGRDLLALVVVGAGSSAIATILFTKAFIYGSPTTPLLLQKMQPFFAVLAARMILGERVMPRYVLFFALGVSGAYLITFPDPTSLSIDSAVAAALAVGAAALWGLGTVLGRHLSSLLSFAELTALRFAIGLIASAAIVAVDGGIGQIASVDPSGWTALFLLALFPGLVALLVYYRGLRDTPASLATLAELTFPLTAIVVNRLVFDDVLSATQWLGVALLSGTILVMAGLSARGARPLGVEPTAHGGWAPEPRPSET